MNKKLLFWFLAIPFIAGFTACGDDDKVIPDYSEAISASIDTLHLFYKGEELAEATKYFTTTEADGVFAYEVIQPKKKETGFGTNGQWAEIPGIYELKSDGTLVAADSLPAPFDLPHLTSNKRELEPGYLRASLKIGGEVVNTYDIPIVQDSITPEVIKIDLQTEDLQLRLKADNSFAVGNSYIGTSNYNVTKADFKVIYSDESSHSASNGFLIDGDQVIYLYYVTLEAANKNGSVIGAGTGSPISFRSTTYTDQFYINYPAVNPQVGDEGYIYVYPYETSKDDWRTLKLTVRTASVSGIVPNPDDSYLLGATARRFRTGVKAAVQGNFYARIKLSDGTVAPYTATEGGGATATASLQVIADSWNNYNGSPALEPVLSTAAARNGSVLKANPAAATNTSTNAADYLGFYQVQLTDAAKDAPEGTAITFKVCPKNHFNSDGTPDPAWTVSVTTQVYKD